MKQQKVFVAGSTGMVGTAIVRRLQQLPEYQILVAPRQILDLRKTDAVDKYLENQKPDWIILAAAKVGGIHANNTYPADFIYDNLMIEANLIKGAYDAGVEKLLFLGSSCIYPKLAQQPIKESELLNGALEPTNDSYAVAKIAGIKLCEAFNRQYGTDYRSLMPTNLYGPNDNFHPENSHVLPALIRRFHEAKEQQAKEVVVWGSGTPMREFLHVDDLADAVAFVMGIAREDYWRNIDPRESHLNLGTGVDVSIRSLAELVREIIGFKGAISFDSSKPDGTPRKLLDVSRLKAMGWSAGIKLEDGLKQTYEWYLSSDDNAIRSH